MPGAANAFVPAIRWLHGAGRDGAAGRLPCAVGVADEEAAGAIGAGPGGVAANGNGCCLKADDRAGAAGPRTGGGCVGKLGLTTDISAAWAIPGETPITAAITARSLRIFPSLSRQRTSPETRGSAWAPPH